MAKNAEKNVINMPNIEGLNSDYESVESNDGVLDFVGGLSVEVPDEKLKKEIAETAAKSGFQTRSPQKKKSRNVSVRRNRYRPKSKIKATKTFRVRKDVREFVNNLIDESGKEDQEFLEEAIEAFLAKNKMKEKMEEYKKIMSEE